MRRAFLLSFLLLLGATAWGQGYYDHYTGFEVPTTAVLPSTESHPSLWFSPEDLAVIKARWNDPAYADLVAEIKRDISTFKNRDPEATSPNERPRMAKTLAFAWIVGGDIVALVKALETLALAYENVPQTYGSGTFDGDYDEIYRATWLQNYCAAYDWLYDQLSPEVEAQVRERLVTEAQLLYRYMDVYAPRPHNHRSKPAYALGTAALTLSSHPDAATWLSFALSRQNTVTRYMFSHDGIYREGPHYYVYSLVNGIPFLWHYLRVSGVNLFPYYQPAFEWPVRIRSPRGWMPNIEDGFMKPAPTHTVAAAYLDTPTTLHTTAPLGEILQWNWKTTRFFTQDYTGATRDVTWEIDVLLTWDASIPATPPDAPLTQVLESGQVAFRNTWSDTLAESRYLLFHGVAEADNHNHPDHLSYVLNAYHTPLAVDAGYGPDGFSDDRRSWYTSPQAHNTVTVNGFPLIDYDPARDEGPHLLHILDSPFFTLAEMAAPSNGVQGGAEVRRGIAFLDQAFWAVYDFGTSQNAASYQVHVHGRGTLTRAENAMTWTVPADRYGEGARLHAVVTGLETPSIQESDGWTSLYWGHEEPQRYISARLNGTHPVFLHLLYPLPSDGNPPPVDALSGTGITGLRIQQQDTLQTYLAVQWPDSLRTLDRLRTDARFVWIETHRDVVARFGMTEGQTLMWNDTLLLSSTLPLTLSLDRTATDRHVLYVESFEGSAEVVVQLSSDRLLPTEVILGSASIPFERLSGNRVRFLLEGARLSGKQGTVIIRTTLQTASDSEAPGQAFLLEGLYPFPATDRLYVRCFLEYPQQMTVTVYDVLGRQIAQPLQGVQPRGISTITWEIPETVAPGMYAVEVTVGDTRTLLPALILR